MKTNRTFLQSIFHIHNERLKKNLLNALPFWTGSFLCGFTAVLYARLFSWAETFTLFIYQRLGWWIFITAPLCFLLSWWLVKQFSPFAGGSGIPQVIAAIELTTPKHYYRINSLLSIRVIFIKIISNIILVLGGGVTGREGPTIQISASIFKKINDLLPAWYPKISKRNMLVTGAAAGLAAAFNTPLGGIVFAIEELTKMHFNFFKSALLAGVIIAGLTTLSLFGPYLYLGYPVIGKISGTAILAVLMLSLISGLAASYTGKIILYLLQLKKSWPKIYQHAGYAMLCGLMISLLAYFVDFRVLNSGKDIMITTLFSSQKHEQWYIPLLRICGMCITFSSGAAGGIFAPALSAGAAFGSALSGLLNLSLIQTNLVILCGMTGFLTGISRSPFTSAILVLEMTNSHNLIFYILLTALLANLAAGLVSRHSFYDYLKDYYIHEIHQTESQHMADEELPPNKEPEPAE